MPTHDRATTTRRRKAATPPEGAPVANNAEAKGAGTRTEAQPDGKVPLTLKIRASSAIRLKVHSLAEGKTASDIVADLIDAHLTKHTLTTRED